MLVMCLLISQTCVIVMGDLGDCEFSLDPFPSPDGHCHMFYECVHDEEEDIIERNPVFCDDINCCGKHFSNLTLTCVHPDEALCADELRVLFCTNVGELLSHPTNCSRYFICNENLRPTVQICDDGLHFSRDQLKCIPKRDARCEPRTCDEYDNPDRPTLLPDPTNCRTFFKCHNGQPLPVSCPPNLYFSVERDRCEFPFTVNCTNGVRPNI